MYLGVSFARGFDSRHLHTRKKAVLRRTLFSSVEMSEQTALLARGNRKAFPCERSEMEKNPRP